MKINETHELRIKTRGYGYIGTYEKGDHTIDKHKIVSPSRSMARVKCFYCGVEFDISVSSFVKDKRNCTHCCNKYENSFAYHIQQELGEPLNKYWDWDKNTVNPYCIYKKSDKLIDIKCNNELHRYTTKPSEFTRGGRCPYCAGTKVVKSESFAQYCIDNIDEDFIEKYWSEKNTLDPWKLTRGSNRKIWIKCQNKCYHNDYSINCNKFILGNRCSQCNSRGKVHPLDSFGTLYPEKAKYWSGKNDKSPYKVTSFSNKVYWFVCEECGDEFERCMSELNRVDIGVKCRKCNASKGEVKIIKIFFEYKISFEII